MYIDEFDRRIIAFILKANMLHLRIIAFILKANMLHLLSVSDPISAGNSTDDVVCDVILI